MTTLNRDELHEQIAEYEATIASCEHEIGAATLDGRGTAALTRRVQEARSGIEQRQAALDELARRETSEAEREQLAAASARRLEEYSTAAQYMARLEAMFEAQAAARAAEDAVLELRGAPGLRRFAQIQLGSRHLDSESVDLDADLVVGLPSLPTLRDVAGERGPVSVGGEKFTAERARQLRALAEQRAAQEAAGEGTDFSGVPSTRARERAARRAAMRAERVAARGRAE